MANTKTYSFGIEAILGRTTGSFLDKTACIKEAVAAGFNFVMEISPDGTQKIIVWGEANVINRAEALEKFVCDGDKRRIIEDNPADVWVVIPISEASPAVFPFGGKIQHFEVIKL